METNRAVRRQPDAGDDLEQRGFPGAVHTEERDELAVVDGEIDVEEHLQFAVREVDALTREHRQVSASLFDALDLFFFDYFVDESVDVLVHELACRRNEDRARESGDDERNEGTADPEPAC